MNDGELIASFEPGEAKYVVVLAFDDLEDAILTQERVTSLLCGWTDGGERFDRVQTLMMAQAQFGRRELFDGNVVLHGMVTTRNSLESVEKARRAWSAGKMQATAPRLANIKLSDGWALSSDQQDYFDKWVAECVEADPAGVELSQRRVTNHVRRGFNVFVKDHGRPDLQLVGSPGGRALSAMLQSRFADSVEVRQGSANNVYYHGLRRKPGANPAWFPGAAGSS